MEIITHDISVLHFGEGISYHARKGQIEGK